MKHPHPTAPILKGALTVSGQWILMQCSQFSKDWAKLSGFYFQSNTHCLKLCYFDWQAYGFLRTLYAAQMVNLGACVLNFNWLGCRYHVMWVANSMKDAVLVLWKLESWLFLSKYSWKGTTPNWSSLSIAQRILQIKKLLQFFMSKTSLNFRILCFVTNS